MEDINDQIINIDEDIIPNNKFEKYDYNSEDDIEPVG